MITTLLKYNGILFIWLSFIFSATSLIGQKDLQRLEELRWETLFENTDHASLNFPNSASYSLADYSVISYEKWMDVASNWTDINANITDVIFEEIDETYLPAEILNELEINFKVFSDLKHINGKTVAKLNVLPFRKNKNNKIERLLSFRFQLNGSTDFAKLNKRNNNRGSNTAANSVLSSGEWYKIAIGNDGVYQLNYNNLQDLGIDMSSISPNQINLYGNGGTMLPFDNSEFFYDDLQKNAIEIVGDDDGVFNTSDYILFYGKGPNKWDLAENSYEHTKHIYSDSSYYFIRVDDMDPKRVGTMETSSDPEDFVADVFDDYAFIENNSTNLVKSGRTFYGDFFEFGSSKNFNFNFPNLSSDSVFVEAFVVARSIGGTSSFDLTYNDQSFSITPPNTSTSVIASVARTMYGSSLLEANGDQVQINMQFDAFDASSEGWLDWIRVNVQRELIMENTQMEFRNYNSVGLDNITQFNLSDANNVSRIWDITDITNAEALLFEPNSTDISFKVNTSELREFIAFSSFNFLSPTLVGKVENQDLHALIGNDMIIVCSPFLVSQSEEVAELHRAEGLTVAVVTPLQVYNEFSSGNPDVTAIKKFMKHLYDSAEGEEDRVRYLLMFGDASYKGNKSLAAMYTYNVMSFESRNSLSPVDSYVTDDYFGFLDDFASESSSDDVLIGVGRIPVNTAQQANAFVNKIRVYMGENTSTEACSILNDSSVYGPWRNVVCFVADDKDGNGNPTESYHMSTSDEHSDVIYENYNDYNVEKIYMDAFQQFSTPGGERYPEASAAIRNRVQDGALLMTYIGHGGERGWSHERVLDNTTIKEFTNLYRMPVFFTATCELARYDNPDEVSAGEYLITNPNGGAIAMLTTTRIVFSGANELLGIAFFDIVFENENIEDLRLGDINRITKNNGPNSENTRNFSLLGDPALKMAYPEKKIFTTEVNGNAIGSELDTLRALELVNFKGYVGNDDGSIREDFNGFVYPTVYDKKAEVTTLDNDGSGSSYNYEVFRNILYKGKVSAENGLFEFNFIVPKDINFVYDTARVSYYAVDGSLDANGHCEEFIIGGIGDDVVADDLGPTIQLFLNDSSFVYGGITNEDPILLAKIFDDNGINTTGAGIGHDITAILDGQTNDQFILNTNFEADLDTYQSGEVKYQFSDLSEGTHNLKFKVWDVYNNSSESFTEFVVASSADLALDHVLNYPNPFTTRTEFYFEHNQSCEFLDVEIQVFTISGKLVKTISQIVNTEGFRSEGIFWNGRDDFGDNIAKGVYVYKLKVRTPEGITEEKFEKLVILK